MSFSGRRLDSIRRPGSSSSSTARKSKSAKTPREVDKAETKEAEKQEAALPSSIVKSFTLPHIHSPKNHMERVDKFIIDSETDLSSDDGEVMTPRERLERDLLALAKRKSEPAVAFLPLNKEKPAETSFTVKPLSGPLKRKEDINKLYARTPETGRELLFQTLPDNNDGFYESASIYYANKKDNSSLSGFTERRNLDLREGFDILSDSEPEAEPVVPKILKRIVRPEDKSKKKLSDENFGTILTEVTDMLEALKGIEKKQVKEREREKEMAKQRRKKVIGPQHTRETSLRHRVEKRIQELESNPDEYEKLEREIAEYDTKNKREKIEAKRSGLDIISRNKTRAMIPAVVRTEMLSQSLHQHEMRLSQAKKMREANDISTLERFREKNKSMEEKRLKAQEKRETRLQIAALTEKKIRWSFISVLVNRINLFGTHIIKSRFIRRQKERFLKLTGLVHSRFMPLVIQRRQKRWRESWDIFQKHWIFYRLWMGVKQRKEATNIIKAFLSDANLSLQFVKAAKMFRQKIVTVQNYVKQRSTRHRTQMMVMILQVYIQEAKMLIDAKEKEKRAEEAKSEDSPTPTKSRKSTRNKKHKASREDREEKSSEYQYVMVRSTFDIKRQLCLREFDIRKTNFAMAKQDYDERLREYLDYVSGGKSSEDRHDAETSRSSASGDASPIMGRRGSSSYTPSRSRQTTQPIRPVLRCMFTEHESRGLVAKALKKMQEQEDRVRADCAGNEELFAQKRDEYEKDIAYGYETLKRYFGATFESYAPLFEQLEKLYGPESESQHLDQGTPETAKKHKKKKKKK